MQNEVRILARQCHAQDKVFGWGVKEESRVMRMLYRDNGTDDRDRKLQKSRNRVFVVLMGD